MNVSGGRGPAPDGPLRLERRSVFLGRQLPALDVSGSAATEEYGVYGTRQDHQIHPYRPVYARSKLPSPPALHSWFRCDRRLARAQTYLA